MTGRAVGAPVGGRFDIAERSDVHGSTLDAAAVTGKFNA
jgi:hypothetical protein